MTKSNEGQRILVRRLTLLKFLLNESIAYLSSIDDEYRFAIGISMLHDSVENLFWAIETFKKVGIKDKHTFPDKYSLILSKLKSKKFCFDSASINELNTIRNAYKHQGILPNTKFAKPLTEKIILDFGETIKNTFNINFDNISLSQLLDKEELRKAIQNVEKNLVKCRLPNDYKQVLYDIGKIYFDFHETHDMSSFSSLLEERTANETGKKLSKYKFPDRDFHSLQLELLELGIVPYLYYRFKNLVPTFGMERETKRIIPKYETVYWGKENWTKLNAEFCLNWMIEYFLKKQWLYSSSKYNITMHTTRYHILEVVKDFKTKLNKGIQDSTWEINFKKGEFYFGNFINFVEGQWQDFNEEADDSLLVLYSNDGAYDGKVPKYVFKIKEIHIDDLPDGAIKILYDNADKAITKLEESV